MAPDRAKGDVLKHIKCSYFHLSLTFIQITCYYLNNNNLRLDTVNRMKRQGGGIALLHKKEYNTTKLETDLQLDTIEHGVWSTTIRNKKLALAGIYHPPIGSSKGNTHTNFLDEEGKLTQLLITNYTNLVLLGDFNIHTQDTENPDSIIYNDTMEALGLKWHIDKPTDRLGNTLDLHGKPGQSQSNPLLHR